MWFWSDNPKATVRVLVRRGVSSAPFVLTRPSLQPWDEQIRRRGLLGILSNLLSPPGWGWLWAGREQRSAAPKLFVTGGCDHSPRLPPEEKNCHLWLSRGFNRWASSQFKGNLDTGLHSFRYWWTASCATEMTVMKEEEVLCSALFLGCYRSLMWHFKHSEDFRNLFMAVIFWEFREITAVYTFNKNSLLQSILAPPAHSFTLSTASFCDHILHCCSTVTFYTSEKYQIL